MKNFMPHDLIGWLTVLTSVSGAVWVVIKFTFVKSFDMLNETMKELKNTIGSVDQRIDNLDLRTSILEDWRAYHDKKGASIGTFDIMHSDSDYVSQATLSVGLNWDDVTNNDNWHWVSGSVVYYI